MIIARVQGRDGEQVQLCVDYYDEILIKHLDRFGNVTSVDVHPAMGSAQATFAQMAQLVLNNQWDEIKFDLEGKYDNE